MASQTCLLLLTHMGSVSDKADSTSTPRDERRPWQSRKPSKPRFHHSCSGKAMPFSAHHGDSTRGHVTHVLQADTWLSAKIVITVPAVLPHCHLCGDCRCLLERNWAPGGGTSQTGRGPGTSPGLCSSRREPLGPPAWGQYKAAGTTLGPRERL